MKTIRLTPANLRQKDMAWCPEATIDEIRREFDGLLVYTLQMPDGQIITAQEGKNFYDPINSETRYTFYLPSESELNQQ